MAQTPGKSVLAIIIAVACMALSDYLLFLAQKLIPMGLIHPKVNDILNVSVNVAVKVSNHIFDNSLAGLERPNDIRSFIKSKMYEPVYIYAEYFKLKSEIKFRNYG
jgi:malate dehydrogenase (oxaloacetate-decarboxylating)(NADP+)